MFNRMFHRRLNRRDALLGISTLSLAVAGCTETPLRIVNPPNFSNLTRLNLNVSAISVESLHDNRSTPPHVEGLSPYPLEEMVQRWLSDTVSTVGSVGQINIQIINASIIEEKLPKKPGLTGLFSIDQTEEYHGNIELLFQIIYPESTSEISISGSASRSVDETVTLRERQQTWVSLGEKMIYDIDQELRQNIEADLPRLFLAS